MAQKKKPVDGSPICDPACLRRIDPIWIPGRVPRRFWEDVKHRRDYLLWLAGQLGFRTMEDFYRLEFRECRELNYSRVVTTMWRESTLEAVQDCFPDYDWKPWLFSWVRKGCSCSQD
jgi:hypothetical protein